MEVDKNKDPEKNEKEMSPGEKFVKDMLEMPFDNSQVGKAFVMSGRRFSKEAKPAAKTQKESKDQKK